MTIRVIVHVGFHKTGTSSLQSYLGTHETALAPYFAFYGKSAFLQAGSAARIYGQKPFRWRLAAFRAAFDRFLTSIPDDQVIVLSRETFSGAMPGHRRLLGRMVRDYNRAAVPLGREIIAALRARFGPEVRIEFLYTLRDRESWIRSVYGHLLRSIHLREGYDVFRARFPDLVDPAQEAMKIAAQLPLDDVHFASLEEIGQQREGPASCVLDLVNVPPRVRAALPAARRANIGQSQSLESEFLTMNRGSRDKVALKRRKDQMIKEAKR